MLQTFAAAEGFIRGRSYNIRMDDHVLLRFSPKNSDSTYYFSDMVIVIFTNVFCPVSYNLGSLLSPAFILTVFDKLFYNRLVAHFLSFMKEEPEDALR